MMSYANYLYIAIHAALSAFVNGELSAFLSIPKSDSGSL